MMGLHHLVLTVRDIEATAAWYVRVLGMRDLEWQDVNGVRRVSLYFSEGAGMWRKINLHRAGDETVPHAKHPTPGGADLCFIVDYNLLRMREHLAECEVAIEVDLVERTGAMSTLSSIYIRDPDGNLLELSEDHANRYAHIAEWDETPRL